MVRALEADQSGRAIVLVSKDINMRIKARALGLAAEDYFNDHVLEDTDLLYSGIVQLPDDFWAKHGKGIESWQEIKGGYSSTFYRVTGPFIPTLLVNQFVFLEPKNGEAPLLRPGQARSTARPPCCRPCATIATTRTTSGASPRATASRTSR